MLQLDKRGTRGARRWTAERWELWRFVLGLLRAFGVLGLVCCANEPDPIGRDVQSVKGRSIPLGGRLIPSYGPGREGQVFRASWEIETDMTWSAYAAWVVAQLPEFHVRANDVDGLRMSRPLEGDVYALTFRRKTAEKSPLIEVTFEARSF